MKRISSTLAITLLLISTLSNAQQTQNTIFNLSMQFEAAIHENEPNDGYLYLNEDQMEIVLERYFALKDALVTSVGADAAIKAKDVQKALQSVLMTSLSKETHEVWMRLNEELISGATLMANTEDIEQQRSYFITFSKHMYELIKTVKRSDTVFYQFCPMANKGKGANWLSKESSIKNPYYGAKMLSCGKVVETIK